VNVQYLIQNGADVAKAIDHLGTIDAYNETMGEVLETLPEQLDKIKTFKEAEDMPNYAILVHGVKSSLKYIGFYKVAEIFFKHETESKANNIDFVNNNYDELIVAINKVISICEEYLSSK